MKLAITFIIFVLTALTSGCSVEKPTVSGVEFTGTVIYLNLEGGFWGVKADNGDSLDGDIPKDFQVKGLKVKGRYELREGIKSYHMWGKIVRFLDISKESLSLEKSKHKK